MKIERQYFSYEKDFNVVKLCETILNSGVPLLSDGTIVTFESPVEIKINGQNVLVKNALNFCHAFASCTPKELVLFQTVFNRQIEEKLANTFTTEKIKNVGSVFLKTAEDSTDRLAGVSYAKMTTPCGIGWTTLFLDGPPQSSTDVLFDTIPSVFDRNKIIQEIEESFYSTTRMAVANSINAMMQ